MPENIEPTAALNPRAKKAFWPKRTRKGERMRNDNQGGKEIAVCKDQDRPRGYYGGLTEQKNSGDEIGDEDYR
jgi:hypothetical protein